MGFENFLEKKRVMEKQKVELITNPQMLKS